MAKDEDQGFRTHLATSGDVVSLCPSDAIIQPHSSFPPFAESLNVCSLALTPSCTSICCFIFLHFPTADPQAVGGMVRPPFNPEDSLRSAGLNSRGGGSCIDEGWWGIEKKPGHGIWGGWCRPSWDYRCSPVRVLEDCTNSFHSNALHPRPFF